MSASAPLRSFLELQSCRYGTSRLVFRGPGRPLNGRHIAFVGGSETVGRSLLQAYPDIIEERLGEVCINFGQRNASIDVAMQDPLIGNACRDAVLTVVSVTGAVNMSNRFYSVHPRRNDRFIKPSAALQALYPEVDYSQICFTRHLIDKLRIVSPSRFERVREELQAAWSARMRSFLEQIGPDVILTWFAPHAPDSHEQWATQGRQWMQEPIFVTREMLTALRPLVRNLVVIPPAPASSSNEPLGLTAHRIAADALAPPIREAIRARSVKRNRRPSLPEAAATKHMSAVTEEPIVAVPIVLPGRSPLVDELSGEARDVAPLPEARHSTIQHRDARRVSIAILPFSLASSEGGTPAFADMLAEDIAVAFHRQQGVEVRLPPTITDQHLTSGNIEQLKEGGLSYVLVGSIAVMGQEIRLTAKLLDLRAGCFVWIQHFNPQLPQSLQTVTELGQEVAARVLAGLSQTYATGSQ